MTRPTGYIETAADHAMLRVLLDRYAWEIDHGTPEGWSRTYTPKGIFEVPDAGIRVEGTEDLVAFAQTLQALLPDVHHVMSGFVFDVDGDRASGRCELNQFMARPEGVLASQQGWYQDDFVFDGSEWRLSHRRAFTQAPASAVAGRVGEYSAAYFAAVSRFVRR